ncbi:hypothetical protein HUB98_05465 [Paenibacillus barcinonensis]|uniref:Uncharacterized protein n=1 Tax=Paenibacillus barcinonensis TaxID=198119 RepID=A0A2V4VVF9_PAEBA|nr:hypothetical protein [Paenibacillus barcinonensis]PYE51437.1 hypothetical protein DFQ00_102231 [Paenibacillus barcinonensis]QKS55830.1 hypothetical protein HUB98_05465 [Paenibacillus barcinonensis]
MSRNKVIKYIERDNVTYKIIYKNNSEWIERVGVIHSHNVKIKKKICPLVYQTVFNVNYSLNIGKSYIEEAINDYFGEGIENGQSTT